MKANSPSPLLLVLLATLWLVGCSGDTDEILILPPAPDPDVPQPTQISEITSDNAVLLTRSAMAMVGGFALIADIATEMLLTGAELMDGPYEGTMAIPQCENSGHESGPSVNELRFWDVGNNFDLPPGDALTAAFTDCEINGFVITGFLHIAGITRSNLPSDISDWSLDATVAMSPIQIVNGNDTFVTYTDDFSYSANRSGTVLTVDIEAPEDPDAGIIGGVNAQHHLTLVTNNQTAINYQFRPFRITTVDNSDGDYRLIIRANSGAVVSSLNRYTTTPSGEIILRIATEDGGSPVTWNAGKPASYLAVPDSGAITFSEGAATITATVTVDGVDLIIDLGSAVVPDSLEWEELLAAPPS